jgi:hypothetical protein
MTALGRGPFLCAGTAPPHLRAPFPGESRHGGEALVPALSRGGVGEGIALKATRASPAPGPAAGFAPRAGESGAPQRYSSDTKRSGSSREGERAAARQWAAARQPPTRLPRAGAPEAIFLAGGGHEPLAVRVGE